MEKLPSEYSEGSFFFLPHWHLNARELDVLENPSKVCLLNF